MLQLEAVLEKEMASVKEAKGNFDSNEIGNSLLPPLIVSRLFLTTIFAEGLVEAGKHVYDLFYKAGITEETYQSIMEV
tara:strand:- start:1038 stop:1271 length:234 start_codon:yes stop_codon:yes gene_type:complete